MCDPRPGARCSADTFKALQLARERYVVARNELADAPNDPGARRKLELASRHMKQKQWAFDSSPRGQAELRVQIADSQGRPALALDELRTRLARGRLTRLRQKRALVRAQGGSRTHELREAAKTLRRLRHPDTPAFTSSQEPEYSVGFFVSSPGGTQRKTSASSARWAAAESGAHEFYDAQVGARVRV